MRTNFFVCMLVAVSCIGMVFGLSGGKKAEVADRATVSVVGLVKVMGNEPNTWLGFVAQDGSEYSLVAEDEVLLDLRQQQGVLLQITGILEPVADDIVGFQQLRNGTIHVQSVVATEAE